MLILTHPLRRAAIAAITAVACSLPLLAIARADPASNPPTVKIHHQRHSARLSPRRPLPSHRHLYGSTERWGTGRCAWPYQNQFPPCMSTFPEGSPNYHGPRPGPTFGNE
jgi:hypothetical protein